MNNNGFELELPKIDLSAKTLQDKYDNGILKDHLDCRDAVQYTQHYKYESKNSTHYFYDVETDELFKINKI